MSRESAVGTLPVEAMKTRLQKLHELLAALNVEGESGAGLVKITVNGKFEALRVSIDPSLIKPEDAVKLGNLIVIALQDAKSKIEVTVRAKIQELNGNLPLSPDLKPS